MLVNGWIAATSWDGSQQTTCLVDLFTKHFTETPLLDEYLRTYVYDFRDQYDKLK